MDDNNINLNEINDDNLPDEVVNGDETNKDYLPDEIVDNNDLNDFKDNMDGKNEPPNLEFPPSADVYQNTIHENASSPEESQYDNIPEYRVPKNYSEDNQRQNYRYQQPTGNPQQQDQVHNPYASPQNNRYNQPPTPYQQNQGGYPPHFPPGGSPYQQQRRGMATVSLVLSILSIVLMIPLYGFGIVMSIAAVIFSNVSKKREGPSGAATAGMVIGIVGIVLNFLFIVLVAIVFALMASGAFDPYWFNGFY